MDKRKKNLNQRFLSFIERSNLKYSNYYDYTKVIYINNDTKVEIICPNHGPFFQLPHNHLKYACKKCDLNKEKLTKISFNKFLTISNIIHNNKYSYIEDSFTKLSNKIKIICPEHGEFEQTAFSHKCGSKCKLCDIKNRANLQKLDKLEAINNLIKVHGEKYDYSYSNYSSYNKKIKIICPTHGEFIQRYDVHLSGCGCNKCKVSIGEQAVINFLNEKSIKYTYNYSFEDCKNINNLKFDFYLYDNNTCIEFDGIQHFEPIEYFGGNKGFEYMKKCDLIKDDYCLEKNIKLIRISYKDYEIIHDILNKILILV